MEKAKQTDRPLRGRLDLLGVTVLRSAFWAPGSPSCCCCNAERVTGMKRIICNFKEDTEPH